MNFMEAAAALKAGKRVQRPHMHDEHTTRHPRALTISEEMAGVVAEPEVKEICLTSYLFAAPEGTMLRTVDGRTIRWHINDEDAAAEDWRIVGDDGRPLH